MLHACFIMTDDERNLAESLSDSTAGLGSRRINNPLANNLGLGEIYNQWIATATLMNNPSYSRWYEMFQNWPIHIVETEILFLPDVIG